MNKAFVKEQDGADGGEDLPDREISPYPNLVTPAGLAAIEAEVARLDKVREAAIAGKATDTLPRIARDLRYWTARRASARLTDAPPDAKTVHFGSTVTIERDDGRIQTFRIVGEDEADPARGTLSHTSPLARALIGRAVGDTAKVGDGEAEITRIQ